MELSLMTPSPDHFEFDEMCSQVEEFEPLPSINVTPADPERKGEEDSSLDDQIFAGLVSPC